MKSVNSMSVGKEAKSFLEGDKFISLAEKAVLLGIIDY
jgi:hypothetical protein